MSIEAIAALSAASAEPFVAATTAVAPPSGQFQAVLSGIETLNGQMRSNELATQQLALGQTDNLHQVMMDMERTRLAFDLVLQVRNKALEADQELMRMQV
jgi:flagellar hook-basal body complex protein FliE